MKTNNQNSGNGNRLKEKPERHQSEQEGSGVAAQREQQQNSGSNASYSEQTDVTPPNHKDFPTVGPSKVDFESRPQGRTTGRMVGHEPGTESL
jgi:hypothetical protein